MSNLPESKSRSGRSTPELEEALALLKPYCGPSPEASMALAKIIVALRSETGTLQAIRAYLDKEYLTSRPAHQVLDGLEKLLKDAK